MGNSTLKQRKNTVSVRKNFADVIDSSRILGIVSMFLLVFLGSGTKMSAIAQNIFSGEPIQVTGQFNSYRTQPYGTDSRTTVYRRLSITSGTPNDGRGQWATTMNVQNSGGDLDAVPTNMPGGNGNGFLFVSGPASNRFQNKWVFNGVGQAVLNGINDVSDYNAGIDMGLNMGTAGYYTFVFNDCGYTINNAKYYVAYTSNTPVAVTRSGETFVGDLATIHISTGASPSAGENIYVRYVSGTNDFSSNTTVVQATGSGTTWSADVPGVSCTATFYYYVFSSTRSLSVLNSSAEIARSLAVMRYDDNAGGNYKLTHPPATSSTTASSCSAYTWNGVTYKSSGIYTYNTTTALGCDSIATLNLTIFSSITSTFSKTDAACSGFATGSITINPTAGTAPFLYRLGTTGSFGTSNVFNGLRQGDYRISIRDANGCDGISAQITIGQQNTVTANFSKTNTTCFGSSDGTITVSPTGGVAPFTYRNGTTGSFVSNNLFTGLAAGFYRVYVQDANSCSINTTVTVSQPVQVKGSLSISNTKCFGSADGVITAMPAAGVAPFSYRLGTTGSFSTSNTFMGLKAANYAVYLQDANGCTNSVPGTVGQPAVITGTATKTDETCPSAKNGSLTVNPSGGLSPYSYRFGSVGSFVTSNTFTGLKAGTYRIFVKDTNGCSGYSIAVTVAQTNSICSSIVGNAGIVASRKENSNNNELGLVLSPNPASRQFSLVIHAGNSDAVEVTVLDINGKVVYRTKAMSEQVLRFGEYFMTGTYLVEVRQGDKVKTLKAVKIK